MTPQDAVGGGPPNRNSERPCPAAGAKADKVPEEGLGHPWAGSSLEASDGPTEAWSLRGSQLRE